MAGKGGIRHVLLPWIISSLKINYLRIGGGDGGDLGAPFLGYVNPRPTSSRAKPGKAHVAQLTQIAASSLTYMYQGDRHMTDSG